MRSITFYCLFLFFAGGLYAQDLSTADRYFKLKSYDKALPLYEEAVSQGVDDPVVHYRLALCYQAQDATDDKLKAIPEYEAVIASGADYFPGNLKLDLGVLYLRDGQLEKSESLLRELRTTIKSDKRLLTEVDRTLDMIRNAKEFISNPRDVTLHNLGAVINSNFTEYNPVVAADQSVMAFTLLKPNDGNSRSRDKYIEEIFLTTNTSGTWTKPTPIQVTSDHNVGTAGISADGQHMLIFIGGEDGTGDLYFIDKRGQEWTKPYPVGPHINSKYLETTASITPDGKSIYFSSDRPGGIGGLDIYVSHKGTNGEWGPATNLGPEVNTPFDEDAPFIHPDQWTLYFTSDGHKTMGGRDIFLTRLFNDKWTKPENLGYPINTTLDDNYFTLSADGRMGFFASDRKGGSGGQDIYSIDMPESESNVALTLIKGRIVNSQTGKAMPTTIYMIDNESGKKLDFVYQPDPVTGDYLIILPPAGNYDMIIESDGFLPYTVNINVPGQTYFYELYQRISLEEIRQFDVVVGQRVEVRNAFYDNHEEAVADVRKSHEAKLIHSGDVDVYQMMNDLIDAGDEEAIDYLLELIRAENPIDEIDFREDPRIEVAVRNYYYDESDESKFEKKQIEGETIYSLPSMEVSEIAASQKNQLEDKKVYEAGVENKIVRIYFDASQSSLSEKYGAELENVLRVLQKYPELGVEISGYASSDGDAEFNRELSNKRAISVLDFLNHKGIVRRRIIARGYGETGDKGLSKEEGRKVEVKIVRLDQKKKQAL